MLSRRNILKLAAALQLWPLDPRAGRHGRIRKPNVPGVKLGPPQPFSWDLLKARAKVIGRAAPYQAPPTPDPAIVKTMDYDVAKNTKYDLDRALDAKGPYPVTFLAVGLLSPNSVAMYAIEGGDAREVIFQPEDFITPPDSPLRKLASEPPPFAGFELRQATDKPEQREHEGWARFIGGSYFPRGGRIQPIRPFRPRPRPELRRRDPGGIPRFHPLLDRRRQDRQGTGRGLRPARRSQRRRRLPLRDASRLRHDDGHHLRAAPCASRSSGSASRR